MEHQDNIYDQPTDWLGGWDPHSDPPSGGAGARQLAQEVDYLSGEDALSSSGHDACGMDDRRLHSHRKPRAVTVHANPSHVLASKLAEPDPLRRLLSRGTAE